MNEYYQRNKERRRAYQRQYYHRNKDKILAYQKQYKRQHVIRYHDASRDIYGVNKAPYPSDGSGSI